jgi:hypothetical protein
MRLVIFTLISITYASAAQSEIVCGSVGAPTKINGVDTWKSGSAAGFRTNKLNVDADGAPDSYRVDGKGLSYTCDGISAIVDGVPQTPNNNPSNWQPLCRSAWDKARQSGDYSGLRIFGFLTKNNKPVIQGEGDAFPGKAFVTTTSMSIPGTPDGTQRHYVDANEIPYVVLPTAFTTKYGVHNGDVAVVYWPTKSKYAFAVFADGGRLGEASVKLHQDIGNDPIVVRDGLRRAKRGIESSVLTIVFPGSAPAPSLDSKQWRADIGKIGQAELDKWGGADKLKACTK